MAEERGEHRGSHGGKLHDTSHGDLRQRIDVPSGGDEYGGNGYERGSDADGECGSGSADDHDTTGESDGDGGSDGDVHGSGGRNSTARLPMAEERGEHRGSHGGKLHDTSHGDLRQRIDVPSGGDEYGGYGDERGSDADGECGSGSADDHDTTGESDSDGGSDGDVHGSGWRNSTARLPMAEERSEHRGSHGGKLHDTGDGDFR